MSKAVSRAHDRVMPETEKEKDAESPSPRIADRTSDALFSSRTVLVFGEITMKLAQAVSAQLVALSSENNEPIRMLVCSPGGHVEAGDTIHDVVRAVAPDVFMIGTGWVASAGALLYAAAKKEHRFTLPNTRFMLHQPLGGIGGQASDIEIEAIQIVQMRARLNRIFADATGQSLEKIAKDTERNFWMTSSEARDYGLVHRVVEKLADVVA